MAHHAGDRLSLYLKFKWRLFMMWGSKCSGCGGDPACPINRGLGTDVQHEFITRGMVMQQPRLKPLIHNIHNCAPLCNMVNVETGDIHARIRLNMARFLGRRENPDADDTQAVLTGQRLIQEWVDSLGLKSRMRINIVMPDAIDQDQELHLDGRARADDRED
jgi:hypothetical protein